jgi:two-component sensor histidine kinase
MTVFGFVRRAIAAPKSPALQAAVVVGGIAAGALVRWAIDRGANGAPFVTFVPVVLLSAIFLQWPFAVLAAIGSLATVIVLFGPFARLQFTVTNYILWGGFAFVAGFMIVTGHVLRRTILELDAQSQKILAFNAELQHRTKNTLQIVRSLASRAVRSTDPVEFYRTLSGRLDALAKANQLLGHGSVQACDLAELVAAAMQPFPAWSVQMQRPPCRIGDQVAKQLTMALHELGTNATKYGSLSTDGGKVLVSWRAAGGGMELVWEERGGPPVRPPSKRGLGSRILSASGALRAVELDYRPDSVR